MEEPVVVVALPSENQDVDTLDAKRTWSGQSGSERVRAMEEEACQNCISVFMGTALGIMHSLHSCAFEGAMLSLGRLPPVQSPFRLRVSPFDL